MDMEIKKELKIQDIMDRCDVDRDVAETLFDCEVEAYAEQNKIEDFEAAEVLYLLDDSEEGKKQPEKRRVYNNADLSALELLKGAFITSVETSEHDDRVFLEAAKLENGKIIQLRFMFDNESVFVSFEDREVQA